MKINCLVENLEKHTALISRIIPVHAQIPVFSNILLQATKDGFFISATDLEIGVRIKIPAKIEEEGAITVPARQFIEIINSLSKDKVSFVLEKDIFYIYSNENKIALQTIPQEEFPDLFNKKGQENISFTKDDFKNIFSKLIFAVSSDETRPVLTGVLFVQKEGEFHFVATDGYRLSLKKVKRAIFKGKDEKLIISAKLINEALLLKNEKKDVSFFVLKEANQIMVESEDTLIIGRLIEGDFPNYERVVPSAFKTKVNLEKESFLQALRLASVFSKESANIVKIKIEGGELRILSKASGVGEGEMKIDVQQEGENNEISFNIKFVLDFLKNTSSKNLFLGMNSPLEPGLFKEDNEEDFIHVIMPVRVQE